MTGLIIYGKRVQLAGLTILNIDDDPAFQLDPGDYRMRPASVGTWVRQIIVHTTGGLWPQSIRPGAGARGHARQIAQMWSGQDHDGGERIHSAAQLVIDFDGAIACLCDLGRVMAFHAEGSNPWSIGIEMCTYPDGSIQEATLSACARLVDFLCWPTLPIPRQFPRLPYRNVPLDRMELTGGGQPRRQLGGVECVGVFGHRDNTSERGFGDPGDAIWKELDALGFEPINYAGKEDILIGKARQGVLNARGQRLDVDGVVGPASLAAAKAAGFSRWRDVA